MPHTAPGENVVQGAVNPYEFVVFKPTLKAGFRPIVRKRPGAGAVHAAWSDGFPSAFRAMVQSRL
jgi:pyruvate,water dikinase